MRGRLLLLISATLQMNVSVRWERAEAMRVQAVMLDFRSLHGQWQPLRAKSGMQGHISRDSVLSGCTTNVLQNPAG